MTNPPKTSRIVIVTGAGIGIGQATANAFASAGDHVVVTDIIEREGTATVAAIRAAGGSAEFAYYDVRSTAATDALVADIESRHGPIDVVVANAGIAHRTPLGQLTDDKWDHGSSDGEIFAIIWNGAPAKDTEMKPMKGTLTEKNVWDIVNYLRTLGPKPGTAKPSTAKPAAKS